MNALAERGRQWPTGDASARVARGADESADPPRGTCRSTSHQLVRATHKSSKESIK